MPSFWVIIGFMVLESLYLYSDYWKACWQAFRIKIGR